MKKVAIVILNWNGRKLMEEFLPSVVSNSPEWAEVIVADNGSTDDSIEMLKAKFPDRRHYLLQPELWFCRRI